MTDFLVSFLIVGTQKGGTTALAKFLAQHPEICFALGKEVHFFDGVDYDPDGDSTQLNHHYQKAFPNWQGEQVVGEATPIYMYLPFIAERIYRYNPQMKLIFLLRDPVERAISHYNMELGRGLEWLPLPIAIALEPFRLAKDRHNLQEKSSLRCHSYVDRGFYAQQIMNMQQYFPTAQMLFIKTSDLWEQHQLVLQNIYSFLGLTSRTFMPEQELVFKQENYLKFHPVSYALTKYYLQQRFKQPNLLLSKTIGWDTGEWNRYSYSRSDKTIPPQPPLKRGDN